MAISEPMMTVVQGIGLRFTVVFSVVKGLLRYIQIL
jgi:hypothetical protein